MHLVCATGVLKSPLVWQSLQATVLCFPSSGNFVFEWSKPCICAMRVQLEVTWQLSQVAAKAPLCGSVWQPVHFAKESPVYFMYGLASWIGVWHFAQSSFSCAPVSGYFEAAWLNFDAGFHPARVWQRAQSVPTCPRCSSVWQLDRKSTRLNSS